MKLFLWNLYPPFFGAGIRITAVDPDWKWLTARLTLRWWNKNYVGTLFGGSIYSLCDPFHMVLLINALGSDYVVRDKGAEIKFLKKGMGVVGVRFEITERDLAQIRANPAEVQEHTFLAQVRDEGGEVIATVAKRLHIRRVASPQR